MAKKFKKLTKKVVREVAALKAEVADLKTEMAHFRAEQKTKLQAEIDSLQKKLHAELEQAKQGSKRAEKDVKGKVQALEEKAAKAKKTRASRGSRGRSASRAAPHTTAASNTKDMTAPTPEP